MLWQTITFAALLARDASAVPQAGVNPGSADFLRFGCSQLVVERTDPLVNPGMLPSPHLHQIVGGNSFNVTMDPETIDPPTTSSCTSCIYTEDTSNYWTASIYFRSPENGSYTRIPQMANGRLNGTLLEQDGGLTIYYMRPFFGRKTMKMTAMAPGFRMLAGDPGLRSKSNKYPGICHRCLSEADRIEGGAGAPCDSNDTAEFPNKPCPGGIRATVIFPSCWNGELDSPDHQSHVAYAPGNSALAGDKCPSTHPMRIPQVMYEIMYDTSGRFADPKYYQNGKQPLVYSFGDTTGYGAHGDYLFGWKDDSLQRAMDNLGKGCASEDCTQILTIQSGKDAIACTKAQQAKEDIGSDTWLQEIPGGFQVA